MSRRVSRSIHRIVRISEQERGTTFRLLVNADLIRPHPPEIIDPQRIALTRCNCLKAHHDSFLFTRRDRKNSCAQQPIPHPLEQGWITLAANDLLIDLSCPICAHCFARDQLTIDRELEILKRGALRQRKHEIRFAYSTAAIDVGLRDFITQHAIDEVDTHVAALSDHIGRSNAARRHDARSTLPARWGNWTRPRTRWPFKNLC